VAEDDVVVRALRQDEAASRGELERMVKADVECDVDRERESRRKPSTPLARWDRVWVGVVAELVALAVGCAVIIPFDSAVPALLAVFVPPLIFAFRRNARALYAAVIALPCLVLAFAVIFYAAGVLELRC
jgi:hypothetical protein